MRFIVDECCHRLFAKALRDAGHDVRYAAETDRRASDESISVMALSEDRIVLTADYDFGELAVRYRKAMPGVILLAPSDQAIPQRVARLVAIVSTLADQLHGSLTIVEDVRLRFRPIDTD